MVHEASLEDKAVNFIVIAKEEILSRETAGLAVGLGIAGVASVMAGYYPVSTAVPLAAGCMAGNLFSRVWRYTDGYDVVHPAKSTADSVVRFFKYAAKETLSLKTLSSAGLATASIPLSLWATHSPHFAASFAIGIVVCDVVSRWAGGNRVSTPSPKVS